VGQRVGRAGSATIAAGGERDRKLLRMARFCGFAISTAFLGGPALGATPEGARTSPAAGAAPITA
jgi:hypothetical protein